MTYLSINSNVPSLQAQRRANDSADALGRTFERLSTGQRINRASDDAAGLAIQQTLRSEQRVYGQGTRNLNDGISLLSIADAALTQLSDIVVRIQELSTQAATGTLNNRQRLSIDSEAQALSLEYTRLIKTTSFNGIKLFDGTIQGLRIQDGYGANGGILASLGGALGTGTYQGVSSYFVQNHGEELQSVDLDGDGNLDLVSSAGGSISVLIGNGNGTFRAQSTYGGVINASGLAVGDINQDGFFDLVAAGSDSTQILFGNGNGSFFAPVAYSSTLSDKELRLADLNNDGYLDIVSGGSANPSGSVAVQLNNGNGTFKAPLANAANLSSTEAIDTGDVNGDGIIDIVAGGSEGSGGNVYILLGNGDGTFRAKISYMMETTVYDLKLGDINNDGALDIVSGGGELAGGYTSIRLGNGNGTFRARFSIASNDGETDGIELYDVNEDGYLDLATSGDKGGSGNAGIWLGNGNGSFKAQTIYNMDSVLSYDVLFADVNNDGVVDLLSTGRAQGVAVRLSNNRDGVSAILPFSLKSVAEARQAVSMISRTNERLILQRSVIGAFQARIGSAISTVGSSLSQIAGAESRISDADIAQETATMVRQQILIQSASAIMASANQLPKLALSLLS